MLTTTEQTLSAIKAINEEKSEVEHALERLAAEAGSKQGIAFIGLNDEVQKRFVVPDHVCQVAVSLLNGYYTGRLQQLIEKADQLIKSE